MSVSCTATIRLYYHEQQGSYMLRMQFVFAVLIASVFGAIAVSSADAQDLALPVVYQSTILDGEVVSGSVSAQGTSDDPEFAEFYSLFGLQGEQVTVTVERAVNRLGSGPLGV